LGRPVGEVGKQKRVMREIFSRYIIRTCKGRIMKSCSKMRGMTLRNFGDEYDPCVLSSYM
jgi:hypothetical protein